MSDCVFCDIVAGGSPADFVTWTNDSVIFKPLGPVVDGHVLVVPRRHVADAASSIDTTAAVMRDAANYAATRHDSFNIITSKGRAATQSIFHLHFHVIPRSIDDDLMVPWGTVYGENPQDPHWCRVARHLSKNCCQTAYITKGEQHDSDTHHSWMVKR